MAIDIILVGALVLAAMATVMTARLLRAVIGLAVTSVFVAVLMFRLNANIAAVFELSVCAGLIPAIFITSIGLTQRLTPEALTARRRERLKRFWFLPMLVLAAGIALTPVHVPLEAIDQAQRNKLQDLGIAIGMYQRGHQGEYPDTLQELLPRYLHNTALFQSDGHELRYVRPGPDAPAGALVAYFWPPAGPGTNVLYVDGTVQWVLLRHQGELVNPRDGKLIAVAEEVRNVLWALRHTDLLGQIVVLLGGVFGVAVLIMGARHER